MNFTIPVYQRRVDGQLEWRTLGLGKFNRTRIGRNALKLQRELAVELKKAIERASTLELRQLECRRGMRLERVTLELNLRSPVGFRRRTGGVFPVVIESVFPAAGQRTWIAYHPSNDQEWFEYDPNRALDDQAKRFFEAAWAGQDAESLEDLRTYGRDLIKTFSFGATTPSLLDTIDTGVGDPFADLDVDPRRQKESKRGKRKRRAYRELGKVSANVTHAAADGTLATGRPRSPYRERLQALLGGTQKTPTVLIGLDGVGKRTLLSHWVFDLLEADDFFSQRNLDNVHNVFRLNGERLIAGMSYVGEWEKRVTDIIGEARDGRTVLWFDDLHAFGRLGQTRDSDRCLADVFRGPLQRGEIVMCGTATSAQWQLLCEESPAFADTFTMLRIDPADSATTLQMMLHMARKVELAGSPPISPFALRTVLELGGALFSDVALPGAALNLMGKLSRAARADDAERIGSDEVISLLSSQTGLPRLLLRPESVLHAEEVEANLTRRVIGQPEAISAAVDLVMRIHAGLTDPKRPYATYLLTGPTGTGKTELAKALAAYLFGNADRLVRFDMGELNGPDAVSRLIGDRWDPRGLLTDAVRRQPFCVLLLDEIEKAHPAVLYLLLQLLDEGKLADAAGGRVDFSHTVIVMTSNVGGKRQDSIGFAHDADQTQRASAQVHSAVREFFPTELFNRIDRVVPFDPLSRDVARQIAQKELSQLLSRRGLFDRNIFVFTHESAIRHLLDRAFNARDGARSVQRYLESHLTTLVAETLASTPSTSMQILRVFASDEGFRVHREVLDEMPAKALVTESLWDLTLRELEQYAVGLLSVVRELLHGEHLSDALSRARLDLSSDGTTADPGALYALDKIRDELTDVVELFENLDGADVDAALSELEVDSYDEIRSPYEPVFRLRRLRRDSLLSSVPRVDRDELLATLLRVQRWRSLGEDIGDPDAHRVTLELLRVGRDRPDFGPSPSAAGLLEAMARFYGTRRAELVEIGALLEDGTTEVREEDLDSLLELRPRVLVLRLVGTGIRDTFAEEEGCHVWASRVEGAEVVRVRRKLSVVSAVEQLRDFHRAEREFRDALERGASDVPENPAVLLPARRRISFDLPRPGETGRADVEDYALGQASTLRASGLEDILRSAWLRAQSWSGR
ncbi:MAG: AAA family ATPase [Myxococcota bacterium]